MTKLTIRRLTESAILIAVATVLSLFKPIDIPFGGGITICAMVPMILLSYRWGMKWGLFSGFVFGLLQMFIGLATNSFGLSFWSMIGMLLLDYIIAYTLLGLGGIFRDRIKNPIGSLLAGGVVAVVTRYLSHFLSGLIFWGSWAEWFFGEGGPGEVMGEWALGSFSGWGLAALYSGVVNGSLLLGEMVLTLIALAVVGAIPALNRRMESKPEPKAGAEEA